MLASGACPAGAALVGCATCIPLQNVLVGDRTLDPAFGQRLGCLRDAGTPAEAVAVLLATGFYSGRGVALGSGRAPDWGMAGREPLPRAPLRAEAPALYIFLLL